MIVSMFFHTIIDQSIDNAYDHYWYCYLLLLFIVTITTTTTTTTTSGTVMHQMKQYVIDGKWQQQLQYLLRVYVLSVLYVL